MCCGLWMDISLSMSRKLLKYDVDFSNFVLQCEKMITNYQFLKCRITDDNIIIINGELLPNGVYYLTIKVNGINTATKKLVKIK
jgi:hypothetical protein